ncbi:MULTISPECIES: BRO family protein [Clostridium]|jgi:prophage antirepressor-like protein|uniref:BRO-N domain-containing protein n=1 Tax=Clostridium TaxID=1485 RepID=UPI000C07B6AD|nr:MULTISPECIES: BRO family protein [Clostridium]MBS4958821.1 hypothetical protein [Clostridium sp.]MDY4606879.1 BRO family protein [Clostridium tertium]
MNNLQVFKNEKLNLEVRTIQNEDGSISISSEDAAIGFGFTQVKNNRKYVRWETMNGYCSELGFSQQIGKDDYIPESLFYMLGMKASNKVAQEFQKWLAVEVIPSIRKTGSYTNNNQKLLSEFRGQITTLVDDIVSSKINQIEDKCSQYYRPSAFDKTNISHYIKKRLGITKANEEYELVKERVLIRLGATKWEDVDVETLKSSLNVIDESIRVIKMDRPYEQTSLF